ncbi:MAG TPA: hypothetical protein EYF94_02665 [Porticoccaceae bacterium]|jgi:hypothetical protein|nr:hypothetical protein [Methylococcaceae bacterium]HIK79822.1 hypothetical protein [Porticoccaceae bacterium]
MSFYSNMAATATNLLTKLGQTVTVTRSHGEFDPDTGKFTPVINLVFTGKGAVIDYAFNKTGNTSTTKGTSVIESDKVFLLQAGNEPKNGDRVTLLDGDMDVIAVEPLSPAGEVVIYELQLRR